MREQTVGEFWTGIICGPILVVLGVLMLQDAGVFDAWYFKVALGVVGAVVAVVEIAYLWREHVIPACKRAGAIE